MTSATYCRMQKSEALAVDLWCRFHDSIAEAVKEGEAEELLWVW
jgi:hypothetical protein